MVDRTNKTSQFFFIQLENKYSFRTEPTNDQIKKIFTLIIRWGWVGEYSTKFLFLKRKTWESFFYDSLMSDKRRCREKSGF